METSKKKIFEKAVMSAANGKKMLERQEQIKSDLAYYVERGFAESKKEMTSKFNKALYDLAEKRGISLWDLCFSVVPRWNQIESDVDMSDPLNITFNADYRLDLVPLEIDFENGSDFWEVKYRQLKSKIEKLISEKEDCSMAEWRWNYTDKTLPEVNSGDGTSDYVLAFPGCGCLPKVVKYSDGSYTKRGWWTTDFRFLSMRVGGRCSTQQRFPYWSPIEQPTFEKLLEQEQEDW